MWVSDAASDKSTNAQALSEAAADGTASTDTTAGLWLWRPEDLIDEAGARLPQNLTHGEWRQYVGAEVPYRATCANLPLPADETNLVVTNLARFEFGVPRTIARVNIPRQSWMFTPVMGVDVALNQEDLMAHLIAEEMSVGDMMTLLKLRKGQYSLVEERVTTAAFAAGKAVRDLHLPAECVLAAVIRYGELLIPRGDLVLQPGDEVLAVVHAAQVDRLAAILGRAEYKEGKAHSWERGKQ